MPKSTEQHVPTPQEIESAIKKEGPEAEQIIRDPEKMARLTQAMSKKLAETTDHKGALDKVWNSLEAMGRLLLAYGDGSYREIPWKSLVLIAVAIIYFVNPIDLIPDFIIVAGYIDDAAVVGLVLTQIQADLNAFLAWESRVAAK